MTKTLVIRASASTPGYLRDPHIPLRRKMFSVRLTGYPKLSRRFLKRRSGIYLILDGRAYEFSVSPD